jgi:hypothetical protein
MQSYFDLTTASRYRMQQLHEEAGRERLVQRCAAPGRRERAATPLVLVGRLLKFATREVQRNSEFDGRLWSTVRATGR